LRSLQEALGERADGRPLATSAFERKLYRLHREFGIERPIAQFEVRLTDGRRRYIDYAYPQVKLGLEANSFRHHADKTAWSRDNARNAELAALGWRILVVTDDDLERRPVETMDLIARARGLVA
jgi:very-short-patch-repair endonuclease